MSESGPERYQIINRQGTGWTGVNYLALDRQNGRQVVLKPLPGSCGVADSPDAPPVGFVGFQHPNVVSVYDILEESGVRYAVVEPASGKSLADLVAGQGQQAALVRIIASDCLEALAAGAARGLAHGDIKPENILIVEPPGERAQVKLQDFGLAGMVDEKAMQIIVGDVHCLAPERFAGKPPDEHTDLYSLGACLYFALTGRVAFPEVDLGKVEAAHSKPPVQPLAVLRPDVPAIFTAWVERLMAADRDKRPASARVALATLPAAVPVAGAATGASQPTTQSGKMRNAPAKPVPQEHRWLWLWRCGLLACGIMLGVGGTLLWQKYQAQRSYDMANRRIKANAKNPLPAQPPIVLRGANAIIQGKAHDKSLRPGPKPDDELGGWVNMDEYPEWPITIVRPGVFRISLDYSLAMPPGSSGSTVDVLVDRRKISATIKGTGSWEDHMTADLGDMTINQAGAMVLKIKPVAKRGGAVMNLRSLTLTWRERE